MKVYRPKSENYWKMPLQTLDLCKISSSLKFWISSRQKFVETSGRKLLDVSKSLEIIKIDKLKNSGNFQSSFSCL